MSYYLYKLIPSRPSFAADMTDAERAIMTDHVAFWTRQRDLGFAVGFGPVADPAGLWGVAIMETGTEEAARQLQSSDPAISSGLATAEIYPMPSAVVRPHHKPPG